MIIRWRRLVISCWKTILAAEEERYQQQVSTWWFDLYENVVYNLRITDDVDISDHILKVVASLDTFVTSSTLGDFEKRLQLLRSFARHAQSESSKYPVLGRISVACMHMVNLYEIFLADVKKSMKEQRTVLEKEISETVQLASWRD